ncbi:GGDEF domain-containing protein [Butyrivibrio proteoclasticus]|uniref:bifunctional diguanylate cyclase/phosphodiesterase n=1 Tax=Butyrivibrio proteoclasticus TaxID=43305 RepID=UPI00047C972D|nr:GGDEF domain-containing protein [Butyrivibrio proteoclasticus]
MHYNYYFDICAICILTTIAITSLSRRNVPTYRQRAYRFLYFAVFASTLFERAETMLQMYPQDWKFYHASEMIMGTGYFMAHLASALAFFIYVMAVLDIYVDYGTKRAFFQVSLPYFICAALVAINLFTPVLFYYDETGIYHRKQFLVFYYIVAFYYVLSGIWYILRYNSLMKLKTRLAVSSYIIFVFIGIFIQFVAPSVLVENFCNTISATLVFITLQNPQEFVDEELNILNRKAFLEGLELKLKRNSPHMTIFVTIDNVRNLSAEIGYSQTRGVMKKIATFLRKTGYKEFRLSTYTYRYSESTFAVTLHTTSEEKARALMNYIVKRLEQPWNYNNMAIRAYGCCYLMDYPKHYISAADLISKLDIISEYTSEKKDDIIDIDSIDFSSIKKARDYDEMARNSMDLKKAVVKFQPMLSKVYKINYSADVFCFLIDEYGNEIDMRGHIPDVKVTQALMDVDEFVYRRACRALAFWNGGDKNGKYRAIVGLSQGEISRNDFVRRIKKILKEENAEASWISFKLTETTISTMNYIAERNLKLMGELNCSIIVDKYGSGYGNLDKMLTLPIMQVNIDHDILVEAQSSEKMKIVAQGIVNLFHDVSIFVGATEISCQEDKEMAESLGCDFLMGDFMGQPMKDSSYVKFIDAYFDEG